MYVFNLILVPILLLVGLNGVRQAVTYRSISWSMRVGLVVSSTLCFALVPVNIYFGLSGVTS